MLLTLLSFSCNTITSFAAMANTFCTYSPDFELVLKYFSMLCDLQKLSTFYFAT